MILSMITDVVDTSRTRKWLRRLSAVFRLDSYLKEVDLAETENMLDPSVTEKLRSQLDLLAHDGSLMAPAALDGYYATFREHFGPDLLAALDGEPLLEMIHGRKTKNSLVYRLEYKNDGEFPTKRFGGIGGGAAFKFGLFYRRTIKKWIAKGEGNIQKELTISEAVEIARQHRDQLMRGVELLSQLPDNGTDIENLQKSLDRDAPQVSQSACGHKYFALLFPSKLDDYHSPKWQRFHLLKMLQLPPGGDGR